MISEIACWNHTAVLRAMAALCWVAALSGCADLPTGNASPTPAACIAWSCPQQ